jgi:hypothetical protein
MQNQKVRRSLNDPAGMRSFRLAFLIVAFLVFQFSLFAQDPTEQDRIPADAAPPPIKQMSKDERAQLSAAKDVKMRTKLTLELMEARMKAAEQYLPQEQLEMVFRELGGFHALIIDALAYLANSDSNKKRQLDNFKRFEIGLRAFTHRIELIRREMPSQREYYVRLLLREIRDARAKAVEPLFGNLNGELPL